MIMMMIFKISGFFLKSISCFFMYIVFFPIRPQIAQQEAQRAQYIVEKAKQERQQKVVQAEGEAASAKLVSFLDFVMCNIVQRQCPRSFNLAVVNDVFFSPHLVKTLKIDILFPSCLTAIYFCFCIVKRSEACRSFLSCHEQIKLIIFLNYT